MKVLDLFSGIGGFSLGLERAGMETVAFCEFDAHARQILKKHWPDVPIHEDVRTLDGTQYRGAVDVICGGFPCQDLSVAGKQKGISGERSGLYREMLRIIGECRPRFAIFENVTGLLSGDSGRWFAQFLYDLAEVGYDAEWHCISASELGAHHHRDRVWIIAYTNDYGSTPAKERQGLQEGDGGHAKGKVSASEFTRLFGERVSANTNGIGCERFAKIADHLKQQIELVRGSSCLGGRSHLSAPPLCGKADGLPRPLDRIKRLGNAVVPQIPEIIGRAIMELENES